MTSYAKRIRDLSPSAGVLAAYDRASVAHGFQKGRDRAAEIAAQADAEIRSMRIVAARFRGELDTRGAEIERMRAELAKVYERAAPKVKPLVWETEVENPACKDASGCGKLYRVIVHHDGTAVLRHNASLRDQETHESEAAAKAAAQADYERRILSTLEAE